MGGKTQYSLNVNSLPMIFTFKIIPNKIAAGFFVDTDRMILKFIWKSQETRIAQKNLKRRKKLKDSHYQILKHTKKVQ